MQCNNPSSGIKWSDIHVPLQESNVLLEYQESDNSIRQAKSQVMSNISIGKFFDSSIHLRQTCRFPTANS